MRPSLQASTSLPLGGRCCQRPATPWSETHLGRQDSWQSEGHSTWFALVALALQVPRGHMEGPGRWNPDLRLPSQPGNPEFGDPISSTASLPLSPRDNTLSLKAVLCKHNPNTWPRQGKTESSQRPSGPTATCLAPRSWTSSNLHTSLLFHRPLRLLGLAEPGPNPSDRLSPPLTQLDTQDPVWCKMSYPGPRCSWLHTGPRGARPPSVMTHARVQTTQLIFDTTAGHDRGSKWALKVTPVQVTNSACFTQTFLALH